MRKSLFPGYRGLQNYGRDFFHDFVLTIEEICKDNTLAQVTGVAFLTTVYALAVLVIWALLSFLLAGIVCLLWNWVGWMPAMGYWESYCLTLLSFILFRGPVIHLSE